MEFTFFMVGIFVGMVIGFFASLYVIVGRESRERNIRKIDYRTGLKQCDVCGTRLKQEAVRCMVCGRQWEISE